MEIARLKEAHAASATEIPEQVQLPLGEKRAIGIVEAAQIRYEPVVYYYKQLGWEADASPTREKAVEMIALV